MKANFAPGLHVAPGQAANVLAYDRWIGRWSRLFLPAVISAAEVAPGRRVLDVSTETGEAALMALRAAGASGVVIGADIAPAMLVGARDRLKNPLFCPVAADGQMLPFKSGTFDAVICQLGLQFFQDPARGLAEFYRVLRHGCCAAVCVISTPDRAPMWGVLTRRGTHSWRLKFEGGERDPITDKRRTRYVTVKGTKKAAKIELIRLLAEVENGTIVNPSKVTLAECLRGWLDGSNDLSPKTLERYRQLGEQQIIPHLGAVPLQKLRPAHIQEWHEKLLKSGGSGGRALSARTVGHAHRVLHRALERAMKIEVVGRNVATVVRPPKVEIAEVAILTAEQVADVLARLDGHPLHLIVALALGSGMRRGEICALAWDAVDLDAAVVRVERSLEETAEGLRFKPPKTRYGRRIISLPANVVEILHVHRWWQLEQRMALGLGRLGGNDLVFATPDRAPYPPDKLSRDWGNTVAAKKLPRVMFHALRHSSASALIAAGLDVVTVSRRLGHSSPDHVNGLRAPVQQDGYGRRSGNRGGDAPTGLNRGLGANWVPIPRFVLDAPVLSHCGRLCGEVPERSNGAVSKTVVPLAGDRGFESLPLRHL